MFTLAVLVLGIAYANAVIVDCNLQTGVGCTSSGPFVFNSQGTTSTWNSQCNRKYMITISPLANFVSTGYQCTFYMDVPQQDQFIYTISEDQTSTWRTSTTAYVYGYGLTARVGSKVTATTQDSDWYLAKAHTHPDDNHMSYITYVVEDNKVIVSSTSGVYVKGGSNFLFNPTTTTTHIRLNHGPASSASGVCRVVCHNLQPSFGLSNDPAPNSGNPPPAPVIRPINNNNGPGEPPRG